MKISGISTFISDLSGDKVIGVAADNFTMLSEMPPEAVGGMVTDIAVTPLPEYLRPNTDIQISDETLTVLNVFKSKNIFDNFRGIVRAVRGIAAVLILFQLQSHQKQIT